MPAPWRIRKPGGRVARFIWRRQITKRGIPGIAYGFADAFGLQVIGMVK